MCEICVGIRIGTCDYQIFGREMRKVRIAKAKKRLRDGKVEIVSTYSFDL